jgi:hypothetical protein
MISENDVAWKYGVNRKTFEYEIFHRNSLIGAIVFLIKTSPKPDTR